MNSFEWKEPGMTKGNIFFLQQAFAKCKAIEMRQCGFIILNKDISLDFE